MSLDGLTMTIERDWLVFDDRPVYAPPAFESYYRRGERLELDDDSRHLSVVRFVEAPAEDPSLDW